MSSNTPSDTQEVEQSDLGDLLAPIKPYIEKYGTKVALGLAAVLLIAAGWIWYSKRSAAAATAGWGAMAKAGGPEKLGDVVKDFPDSNAATWARLRGAEMFLARGMSSSFTERDAAEKAYKNARDSFEYLLDTSGTPDTVRERALWGMARLEEAGSGEDTSAAVAAYKKLLSDFPESIFKELSKERIEELEKPTTKRFYAWFKKQDRSIADGLLAPQDKPPETPGIGEPGVMPPLNPGLPPAPSPVSGGDEKKAGGDEEKPTAPVIPSLPAEKVGEGAPSLPLPGDGGAEVKEGAGVGTTGDAKSDAGDGSDQE